MNLQQELARVEADNRELHARITDANARMTSLERQIREAVALLDIAQAAIALLVALPPVMLETPEATALREALEQWREQQLEASNDRPA